MPNDGSRTDVKKCSWCGRQNEASALHCLECGTPLIVPAAVATAPAPPALAAPDSLRLDQAADVKKCSWCGRQNETNAQHCCGCGTPLSVPSAVATVVPSAVATAPAAPEPVTIPIGLRPWYATDAWKCLGMFFVFDLLLEMVLYVARAGLPGSSSWSRSGASHFTLSIIHYAIYLSTTLYFARVDSIRSFLREAGLKSPPSDYIWFAVAAALLIRWVGHVLVASGLGRGATSLSLWGFAHSVGAERYLFLVPAFIAPFGEEIYMRGFLYRAFRGSYSVPLSTALIIGITAITHWDQFQHSWIAAVDISSLTVLQCFLRERTGGLWDCVIIHLIYNATGAFLTASSAKMSVS